MQYFLCPRCQFRVPANKHICQTCGNKFVSSAPANSGADNSVEKKALVNPFAKLLGFNNQSKQKDSSQEKPALG
jgi:predicted amidophosphoribosyltransferase